MNHLSKILAATAATAALALFAVPANAAVFINNWTFNPGGAITVTFGDTGIGSVDAGLVTEISVFDTDPLSPNFGGLMGKMSHDVTGSGNSTSAVDVFDFFLPSGLVTSSGISTHQSQTIANLVFTGISFNGNAGVTGTFAGNAVAGVSTLPVLLNGPQHLVVNVAGGDQASWAGTATFSPAAVPEPASWALMIVGFGGLGAVLRMNRRRTIAFG